MNKDLILPRRQRVAKILLEARVQKGLSQSELGDCVGFNFNTISRIEKSVYSPNADQLYALCEALDITITLDGEEI